ncbi:hypothetical protein OH76DRAFT_1414524 [Lentinus brumalis]|uniref:Uncharacterized protein n=1 Tax=Lentinus brumalis TaxID=2498619 RepID=A0A371DU32_9APHY|nr:hypothetical protein OH76DRAFT_1414524 [Polyporus brumalis]
MRSPMLAFSLFAAVGPTIVTAAPSSPKLGDESFTHARNADVNLPQRFALPKAPRGLTDAVDVPNGTGRSPLGRIAKAQPKGGNLDVLDLLFSLPEGSTKQADRKPSEPRLPETASDPTVPSFPAYTPTPPQEPTVPTAPTRSPTPPRPAASPTPAAGSSAIADGATSDGEKGTAEVTDTAGNATADASSAADDTTGTKTTDDTTDEVANAAGTADDV